MKTKLFLSIVFLLLGYNLSAQNHTFTREWTTYTNNPYTSIDVDLNTAIAVDNANNVYITKANNNISDDLVLGSLSKFSPDGELLWTTETFQETAGLAIDHNGDIIIAGYTSLESGIATDGTFQGTFGGGSIDVFLMKFDSDGNRIWGTYFGGPGNETPVATYYMGLEITSDNNIIWTSKMESNHMATNGTFQTQRNGAKYAISKFDTNGQRIWTTYYGPSDVDYYNIAGLKVNDSGIYIMGRVENGTTSNAYFDTTGNYYFEPQSKELFITKFDLTGNRIWSRYIQGNGQNYAQRYALLLKNNNIYVTFTTTSTNFGTGGTSFPNTDGQNNPGVLIKLDLQGSIEWSTYLPENDYLFIGNNPIVYSGNSDGIYVMGSTIASDDGLLGMFNSEIDGSYTFYVMKFNDEGEMIWGNYFGESNNDETHIYGLDFYGQGLYLYGSTEGLDIISTEGVFQEDPNGENFNIFLSKYKDDNLDVNKFDDSVFKVYPNPTSSILTVNLNAGIDFPIKSKLYNTLGQLVKTQNITKTESCIDLSSLSEGVYFLELKIKDRVSTKKIIIN